MLGFIILSVFLLISSLANKKFFFWLSFVVLFIISAFRNLHVGTDTEHYQNYFISIGNPESINLEPLWFILNRIVLSFSGEFEHVLIISSFLVLLPIFYSINKESHNIMLSLFLYFTLYYFFYSLNITRQAIGVSFGLLSFIFLNRNTTKFILCIAVASLFHYSAIILLPLLFLNRLELGNSSMFFLLFLALFLGLFMPSLALNLISKTVYSGYLLNYNLGNLSGNFLYGLVLVGLFAFILFFTPPNRRDKYFKIFFLFLFLTLLLLRVPFGRRLMMYFSIVQVLLFPKILNEVALKYKPIFIGGIISYTYFVFFWTLGDGEIFPYSNTLIDF